MDDVTAKVELTFRLVSGDPLKPGDGVSVADFILDSFAYDNARQNGAKKPIRITATDNAGGEATYELHLVD